MSLIIFTAALLAVARIVEQFEVELDFAAYKPVGALALDPCSVGRSVDDPENRGCLERERGEVWTGQWELGLIPGFVKRLVSPKSWIDLQLQWSLLGTESLADDIFGVPNEFEKFDTFHQLSNKAREAKDALRRFRQGWRSTVPLLPAPTKESTVEAILQRLENGVSSTEIVPEVALGDLREAHRVRSTQCERSQRREWVTNVPVNTGGNTATVEYKFHFSVGRRRRTMSNSTGEPGVADLWSKGYEFASALNTVGFTPLLKNLWTGIQTGAVKWWTYMLHIAFTESWWVLSTYVLLTMLMLVGLVQVISMWCKIPTCGDCFRCCWCCGRCMWRCRRKNKTDNRRKGKKCCLRRNPCVDPCGVMTPKAKPKSKKKSWCPNRKTCGCCACGQSIQKNCCTVQSPCCSLCCMIKRCASTLCCCGQVDDDDDDESETDTHSRVRSTDDIATTDMTEDTSEKDRVDGLVRRKTNTTQESLTRSMLEVQKVNERLFEEIKS